MKRKMNNKDLIQTLYKQKIDTSLTTAKTHSIIDQVTNGRAFLLLSTRTKTISEETTES
jgi:hypothetical protein